ncbi:hypothetical protein [Pelosinus sp. sgz500959]|uniref:hypothetical protein n=1 Tax=Pelosinus sp. sgz500959 TaxID=3242472 RepID=UPI00366B1B2E
MDQEKLIDEIKERYEMVLYPNVNGQWIIRLYNLEDCTKSNNDRANQKKCIYSNSGKALESVLLLAHSFALGK